MDLDDPPAPVEVLRACIANHAVSTADLDVLVEALDAARRGCRGPAT